MPQLKNIAMDQYRKGLSEARLVPDAAEMNEIYRNSSGVYTFRRLMTKIAARQIMDPDSEKDAESPPRVFQVAIPISPLIWLTQLKWVQAVYSSMIRRTAMSANTMTMMRARTATSEAKAEQNKVNRGSVKPNTTQAIPNLLG